MSSTSESSTSRSFARMYESIVNNVGLVLKGKKNPIELAVVCLLADGHLLIEDVPGVGKTSLAKALSASIDCTWKRVQFTPDLLPSDLIGVSIWSKQREIFEFQEGPSFANIVLADEINRASPKTQSALLEAMEERQISVDGVTRPLPHPFLVIATQNPIEHDGTYKLPESQLDRFLIRMEIGYPNRQAELDILEPSTGAEATHQLSPVVSARDIREMISVASQVSMVEPLKNYVIDIAHASRKHPQVSLGLSPRAMVQLARAVRALAASRGRDYSTPDDVKELAVPVLAHRLVLRHTNRSHQMTSSDVIQEILTTVPVPSGR
ncbi:MAG: AAA family ATPase [Actinomycetota bacterium]|nr:AAA family ATPase [Actinomycetota bacterium]MDA3018924.1 AAA family ATPase [Actinomycetota bacterium]